MNDSTGIVTCLLLFISSACFPAKVDDILEERDSFQTNKLLQIIGWDYKPSNSRFHYTCATDTQNIRKVVEGVKDTIIGKNIDAIGLWEIV